MARRRPKPGAANAPPAADDPRLAGPLDEPLRALRRTLADQAREREQAQARARAEAAARERERSFLREAFEGVQPLAGGERTVHEAPRPAPLPRQREQDEQAALQASLSDEIDVERWLDTDDSISYTAPGIGADVLPRLRRGHWAVASQIDLHGLRSEEAREALVAFLEDCRMRSLRCVRVIHGKGLGSANRQPVLKDKVRRWLAQRGDVLAFCQARPTDGGAGAVLVLLAGPRVRSGAAGP